MILIGWLPFVAPVINKKHPGTQEKLRAPSDWHLIIKTSSTACAIRYPADLCPRRVNGTNWCAASKTARSNSHLRHDAARAQPDRGQLITSSDPEVAGALSPNVGCRGKVMRREILRATATASAVNSSRRLQPVNGPRICDTRRRNDLGTRRNSSALERPCPDTCLRHERADIWQYTMARCASA